MSAAGQWKIAAALLALICIALIYRVLDQGITRTYLEASQESSVVQIKLLTGLIGHDWHGLPEKEVMSRLQAYIASQPPGSIVLKHERERNAIYLEGVRFEFRDGKLVSVQ